MRVKLTSQRERKILPVTVERSRDYRKTAGAEQSENDFRE